MDGYVALKRLRWGDGWIEPGERVPAGDPDRNYQSMVYHDLIAPLKDATEMSDEELATAHDKAVADRDTALKRIADLEGTDPVMVPDGVTPGETSGWPIDAVTGAPLALTDEQRSGLEVDGISGEAIVTHQGDIVQIEVEAAEGEPAIDATDEATRLAADNGIDIATVEGSGDNGRVLKPDVQKVIDARASE